MDGAGAQRIDEIIAMAREAVAEPTEEVGAQTRLRADLELNGDAAHKFMNAFAARYDVDLCQMRWRRYFADEGFDPLAPALAFWLKRIDPAFGTRWREAEDAEREITLAHLDRVAEKKRWIDPDVSARPARPERGMASIILAGFASLAPIALVAIMPALLVTMLSLALVSGNWTLIGRNLWLVALMVVLAAWQAWLARNAWKSMQRKLASAPNPDF